MNFKQEKTALIILVLLAIASLVGGCPDSKSDGDESPSGDGQNSNADGDRPDSENSQPDGDGIECTPTELSCLDNQVVHCASTGTYWEFVFDCSTYNQRCIDGHCEEIEEIEEGDGDQDLDFPTEIDQEQQDSSEIVEENDQEPEVEDLELDGELNLENGDEMVDLEPESETETTENDIDFPETEATDHESEENDNSTDPYCFPDEFGNTNNQPDSAVLLQPPVYHIDLSLCALFDKDWYKFNLEEGNGININVLFSHAISDIDIALFAEGAYYWDDYSAISISKTDDEQIVFNAPEDKVYLLRVSNRLASNTYNLSVEVSADGYSIPGNNCTSLYVLELGDEVEGHTISMTRDFRASCGVATGKDAVYAIFLSSATAVEVRLFSDFDSVLSMRSICDIINWEVGCSDSVFGGEDEVINTDVLDPGTYYIIVDGYQTNDEGYYRLSVTED